jgi:hypothetical protein
MKSWKNSIVLSEEACRKASLEGVGNYRLK